MILSMRTTHSSSAPPAISQSIAVSVVPVPAVTLSTGLAFASGANVVPLGSNTRSSSAPYGKRMPGMPNAEQFCHYCWSTEHLYRRDCQVCQEDLNAGRIHIAENGKIRIGRYTPGAPKLNYRREKPQRAYVADQEQLSYTGPASSAQAGVSTMRLGDEPAEDLSSDEEISKPNFVLLRHPPGTNSQALVAAARTDGPKLPPPREPSRRILERKISRENKYPSPKTQRYGRWQPPVIEEVEDEDTQMIEKIDEAIEIAHAQDGVAPTEPEIISSGTADASTNTERPSRPAATKSKVDRDTKKLVKMVHHFRDTVDPHEIAQRIFSGQVTLSVEEVVGLSPDIQKVLTQTMAPEKVVRFSINPIELDDHALESSFEPKEPKIWYSLGCPRTMVTVEKSAKVSALLDSGAEVSVMTKKVMNTAGLIMRQGPRLELVTHTGHHCPFIGVCEEVSINVGGLIIYTPVFVVEAGDHPLVLGQLFLHQGKFSQEYRNDGVFGHLTDETNTHTVVFPTLNPKDRANRQRADLFKYGPPLKL